MKNNFSDQENIKYVNENLDDDEDSYLEDCEISGS